MAKAAKQKIEKKITTEFHGVNIKLFSKTRSGDEMYEKLFEQIFRKFKQVQVGHGKAMVLLKMDKRQADVSGKKLMVYTGEMAKFTVLETDDWLDFKNKVKTKHALPEDLFPNLVIENYLFVPFVHRFYFRASSKVTINNVVKFFEDSGEDLIGANEQYSVSQITSQDQIDKILNSYSLLRLEVDITYTNDDLGDDALEVMDELFKEGNAANASIVMTPKSRQEGLNTDSTLVAGLVQLAKENGQAKATIKEGIKKKSIPINTSNHPERIPVEAAKNEDPFWELFQKVALNKLDELRKRQQDKE